MHVHLTRSLARATSRSPSIVDIAARNFHKSSSLRNTGAMALPKTFTLKVAGGETQIPSVGYGTWASDGSSPTTPAKPEWIKNPLKTAFDIGYRHLDMAWFYGVDKEIGEAIHEHGINRSELFVTSKIWPNFYHPDAVEMCCDKILEASKLGYLDCLLLHWPCAMEPVSWEALEKADAGNQADYTKKGVKLNIKGKPAIDWKHTSEPIAKAAGKEGSIVPTWGAMKDLVKKGKVRAIGVSNFDIADLKALLPHAQDVPISINQVEVHPWFPNTELIDFAKANGVLTSCFSPFAGQKADGATLIKDPTVQKVAKKNDMDVGQLLQSWAVQRGTIPLGKSGNEKRIKTNFSVRKLSEEDVKILDDLEIPSGKGRTIDFVDEWGVQLWQK